MGAHELAAACHDIEVVCKAGIYWCACRLGWVVGAAEMTQEALREYLDPSAAIEHLTLNLSDTRRHCQFDQSQSSTHAALGLPTRPFANTCSPSYPTLQGNLPSLWVFMEEASTPCLQGSTVRNLLTPRVRIAHDFRSNHDERSMSR